MPPIRLDLLNTTSLAFVGPQRGRAHIPDVRI